MTKYSQLCGLGNAIVDIFLEVSDGEFAPARLRTRRHAARWTWPNSNRSCNAIRSMSRNWSTAGSVANSVIAFSQLGGDAAFIGCVGDDRYGLFYAGELEELGIDIGNGHHRQRTTGTCLVLITPDAERTMRTCLAVSSNLAAKHVDEDRIKNSDMALPGGLRFRQSRNRANRQSSKRSTPPRSTTPASPSPARTPSSSIPSAALSTKPSLTPTCSSPTKPRMPR